MIADGWYGNGDEKFPCRIRAPKFWIAHRFSELLEFIYIFSAVALSPTASHDKLCLCLIPYESWIAIRRTWTWLNFSTISFNMVIFQLFKLNE